jgi:hypothetical protein
MKLYAYYDNTGTVRSLVMVDTGTRKAGPMLVPGPDELVSEIGEIEGIDITSIDRNSLRDIGKNYTLAVSQSVCKLVKRR